MKILIAVGIFYLCMGVINVTLILWSVRSGKMSIKEARAVVFGDGDGDYP
jgi:hypothetical protein